MMKFLVFTALFAASATAAAHNDVNEVASLPTYDVTTIEAVQGETRTEFVKRAAEVLRAYTAETGYEACAKIAYGGATAFSFKVVTLKSQIGCGVRTTDVAPGYVGGSETIHSHPEKRVVRLTAVDMKVRGTPAGKLRSESVDNCRFSDQDYNGKGWLVACGKVLYQQGRGTEVEL